MTTAIFLIGLPAAGKSTIRTKLLELYPTATVLSTDDVIETESAKDGITYNNGFQKFIKFATKVLESKLNGAILNNSPIIWDQTNLSVKQRQQKLAKIPKHYKRLQSLFNVIIKRNMISGCCPALAKHPCKCYCIHAFKV